MNVVNSIPNTAIILAGGLGTRLRSVVQDVPKPMASINGKPFLEILLDYWINQGIKKFIISVGYKKEVIIKHFDLEYKKAKIDYVIEERPLGTGGGVLNAYKKIKNLDNFLIINGDTYFEVSLKDLLRFHKLKNSILTLSLLKNKDLERYKPIFTDKDGKVILNDQSALSSSSVNGGVYLINKSALKILLEFDKQSFSLENDFLKRLYESNDSIYGCTFTNKFIDIGTPLDYKNSSLFFK